MMAERRWTRKRTFEEDQEDWVVLRDGLVVGRVMLDEHQSSRAGKTKWLWSLLTMPARNGSAETMEEALEEIRSRATDNWGHQPHGWPDDR